MRLMSFRPKFSGIKSFFASALSWSCNKGNACWKHLRKMRTPAIIKWINKNGTSIWLSFLTLCIIAIILIAFGCLDDIVRFFKKEGWPIGENYKLEVVKLIAYILGGFLVLIQIVVLNRRAKATEEQAKAMAANIKVTEKQAESMAEQAKAMAENIKVTEKGQVQERFKNAIDQLGNDKVAVRLGAIYTLHHIAKDDIGLRKTIFDILCSYIRETTKDVGYKKRLDTSTEMQSILNLLFVYENEREIYKEYSADLHGSYLRKAELKKSYLVNAILYDARLELIDLSESNLQNANLNEAHLEGAYLCNSNLNYSNLWNAKLQGADIREAKLEAAYLRNANLTGSDLIKAHIRSLQSKHNLELEDAYYSGFETWINKVKSLETDLDGINRGKLTKDMVDEIMVGLKAEKSEIRISVRKRLNERIGKETDFTGCITGKMTDEEAQEIIDRYNAAMERKDDALKGIKKD